MKRLFRALNVTRRCRTANTWGNARSLATFALAAEQFSLVPLLLVVFASLDIAR